MAAAKKGLLAILGGPDEGDDEDMVEEPGGDGMKAAKVAAMRRLISAVKSGDAEAAAQAFSDAYDACGSPESERGEALEMGEEE